MPDPKRLFDSAIQSNLSTDSTSLNLSAENQVNPQDVLAIEQSNAAKQVTANAEEDDESAQSSISASPIGEFLTLVSPLSANPV